MVDITPLWNTLLTSKTGLPHPNHFAQHSLSTHVESSFISTALAISKSISDVEGDLRKDYKRLCRVEYFRQQGGGSFPSTYATYDVGKSDYDDDDFDNVITPNIIAFVKDTATTISTDLKRLIPPSPLNISTSTPPLDLSDHYTTIIQSLLTSLDSLGKFFHKIKSNRSRGAIGGERDVVYGEVGEYVGTGLSESGKSRVGGIVRGLWKGVSGSEMEVKDWSSRVGEEEGVMEDVRMVIEGKRSGLEGVVVGGDFDHVWGLESDEEEEVGLGCERIDVSSTVNSSDVSMKKREGPTRIGLPFQQQKVEIISPSSREDTSTSSALAKSLYLESLVLPQSLNNQLSEALNIETSMTTITSLLTTFSSLVEEQSEQIGMIADNTNKAKEDVSKGGEELVKAKERGGGWRKYYSPAFIAFLGWLLLILNWLMP